MSQEKIDRYKQEKANRKKNMKKQRMMSWARKGVLTLAGLAKAVFCYRINLL